MLLITSLPHFQEKTAKQKIICEHINLSSKISSSAAYLKFSLTHNSESLIGPQQNDDDHPGGLTYCPIKIFFFYLCCCPSLLSVLLST